MRWCWLLCAVAFTPAPAQTLWEWSEARPGKQAIVTDAEVFEDQTTLSVIYFDGITGNGPISSKAVRISANGVSLIEHDLFSTLEKVGAVSVTLDQPSGQIRINGFFGDGSSQGYFSVPLYSDGTLGTETLWSSTEFQYTTLENTLSLPDGGVLICGSARVSLPATLPNRVVLVEVNGTGSVVRDTVYGNTNNTAICRKVVEWNGQRWFCVDGRFDVVPDPPRCGFYRINDDLGIEQHFAMPRLDTDPEPPFDSIPVSSNDLVPISSSRFASAGRFGGTWSPAQARAVVVISDTTGALIHYWLPRSTYPQDFTPFLQALDHTTEGDLWFAMHENAQLGPPSLFSVFEPNRLHVYKLDTSLNVLCEHIVDGFAENAYYYLNRIKATDDGGFMLMGGRRNFDDPSGYFEAWARKFGPSDCTVGVQERQAASGATLFPNPGREGFTLLLNGEALQGTLLLHDALGRACGSVPIRQGQARFDAQALATGVYVYHAQDMKGRTLATGWWVKE